jgi:Spy/CpxP family protein refolding chaperone
MLRRVLYVAALALLIAAPRSGWALEAGDPADPMGQYQIDFKRQNLGATLGIDQTKVDRLLQIDQKYKSQKRQAIQEAKAAFQQLQRIMSQPQPAEPEVAALLDNIMNLRKEKLTLEQQQLQEEKSILTPVQQARYILLLVNMRQQIAKEAQKVRSAPQGVPLPAKPGPHEVPVSRPGRGY